MSELDDAVHPACPLTSYHRLLLHGLKWIASAISVVAALVELLGLIDLIAGAGWGVTWDALVVGLLFMVLATIMHVAARGALKVP